MGCVLSRAGRSTSLHVERESCGTRAHNALPEHIEHLPSQERLVIERCWPFSKHLRAQDGELRNAALVCVSLCLAGRGDVNQNRDVCRSSDLLQGCRIDAVTVLSSERDSQCVRARALPPVKTASCQKL